MANASYVQDSFTGGEKSQLAQGRITDKEYRTWMNVCVNGHPTEAGGWVRRSGTYFVGATRGGRPGRVIKFDFAQATPYTMEFTDGFIRFRAANVWATTNDSKTATSVSNANPAVVTMSAATGWSTGNTVVFDDLGGSAPTLQNRQFLITVVDSTHFSIADALTGAGIDGSTIGVFNGAIVSRIQEVVSPYFGKQWQLLRSLQAENSAVLLQASIPPQILVATPPPAGATDITATFELSALSFLDGPYLDPFTNGVQAVPNGKSGTIILTLQFPAWSSTQAYQKGSFVTSSSVNYESLIDNNVGNTPVSSPSDWTPVSAGAAINNGQGFLGTDVGRMVRLFSEPVTWTSTGTFGQGAVVSYNPTGQPGAATYWTSLVAGNTGNVPGNDLTNWQLTPANAAIWSWGKITALVKQIPQGSGSITATMGNFSAAFDGIISQDSTTCCSTNSFFFFNGVPPNTIQFLSIDALVGKNFTGSPQVIEAVTLFPATDFGFFNLAFGNVSGAQVGVIASGLHINLRASMTAPASASSGTLLAGTGTGQFSNVSATSPGGGPVDFGGPITLISSDQTTAWNYVWIEMTGFSQIQDFAGVNATVVMTACVAEVQFFGPPGTLASGNAVNMEILGPPLLYANPCISWRLGAYNALTGYPTCGCYHQGRVWLAGAIDNRFDASASNGLVGTTLNMAPTDQNGTVGAANAIDETVNSDGVNPIFWMEPDLQGVIMGTQAGEFLISAPSPGAITPTNIDANRVTRIGSAFVEPRKTDHTTVFVQRYAKKVMEYFTDVYSGKFSAPNLAKDTMHITKPLVAELAYTQANIPIVWGRNTDGSWWGATYKRDTLATSTGPTINGWHRHSLGSGRIVQSICAGPSVGGALDALTMVTLYPPLGIYYVEIMTDAVDEGDNLLQASYLDTAINPSSVVTTNVASANAPYGGLTINGLWHQNGFEVTPWLGGLDCGDYIVTNGSIFVPYGDGISAGTANGLFTAAYAATLSLSQMLIGWSFTSQGQIVRPATPQESGARNGPAVGKKRRNHKLSAQLEGTGIGVSFGTRFTNLFPAKFRQPNDTALLGNQQFNGVYKDTITDNYSYDGMLCWQVTRPYPCNIANLGGFIETSDE